MASASRFRIGPVLKPLPIGKPMPNTAWLRKRANACGIGTIGCGSPRWSETMANPAVEQVRSSRLTLDRIELAARTIDPVFLHTPQFVCESLSDELGVRVALKIETLNPIRCFKGRGADFLVAQRKAGTALLCASAGNFGQAMAYACRQRGLDLTVFAAST